MVLISYSVSLFSVSLSSHGSVEMLICVRNKFMCFPNVLHLRSQTFMTLLLVIFFFGWLTGGQGFLRLGVGEKKGSSNEHGVV